MEPDSSQSHPPFTFNSDIGAFSQPGVSEDIFATPRSQRYLESHNGTPSFAALSSPTKPADLPVPPSPDFDNIIFNTIHTGKRKREASAAPGLALRRQLLPTSTSIESHASSSSTNSMHSVEQQLTQMGPEDEDVVLGRYIHTDRLADPSSDCLPRPDAYASEIFGSGEAFSQSLPAEILQSRQTPMPTSLNSQESQGSQATMWSARVSLSLQPPPPGQPRQDSPLFLQSQSMSFSDFGPSQPVSPGLSKSFASPESRSQAWSGVSDHVAFPSQRAVQMQSMNPLAKSKFHSGTLPPLKPRRQHNSKLAVSQAPSTTGPIPLRSPPCRGQQPSAADDFSASPNVLKARSDSEESDEEAGMSSQEFAYPPLQTQAPYQSQA